MMENESPVKISSLLATMLSSQHLYLLRACHGLLQGLGCKKPRHINSIIFPENRQEPSMPALLSYLGLLCGEKLDKWMLMKEACERSFQIILGMWLFKHHFTWNHEK